VIFSRRRAKNLITNYANVKESQRKERKKDPP
jgi:hypothetical protein